jgi:uncharacterized membrane protein
MEKNEKLVLDAMKKSGTPMKQGDIVTATQLDKSDVSRIINKLKKNGKVHTPKRCFYEPL